MDNSAPKRSHVILCRLCKVISSDTHMYEKHMKACHGKKKFTPVYICPKCEFATQELSTFSRHKVLHGEKSLKCFDCGFLAEKKWNIMRHRQNCRLRMSGGIRCIVSTETIGETGKTGEMDKVTEDEPCSEKKTETEKKKDTKEIANRNKSEFFSGSFPTTFLVH